MKNSCFSVNNYFAKNGIATALQAIFGDSQPILVCIGTDAVMGDSLGPLVGSLCEERLLGKTFVYGTCGRPLTATDVDSLVGFLKKVHPYRKILAVDAAVGNADEVGCVKICDAPLRPGAGVEKKLSQVGDASLIGVVAAKSPSTTNLERVRLSRVYRIAKIIADGVCEFYSRSTRLGIIDL